MATVFPNRIWMLVLGVLLVPIIPWMLLGPWLEPWAAGLLGEEGHNTSRGVVALAGVGLLASDSFLPIPSTLVMSGAGLALGGIGGGVVASVGLFLSGAVAYLVCRRWGVGMARRICGDSGLARVEAAMERYGPWLILASRSVPVLQEATSCLAGVVNLPARLYFAALAAGCIPTGFAYAAIGASAVQNRWWAVGLSFAVPLVTWALVYGAMSACRRGGGGE